jgi:hypothetical protein
VPQGTQASSLGNESEQRANQKLCASATEHVKHY